jgi:hypothetical protein
MKKDEQITSSPPTTTTLPPLPTQSTQNQKIQQQQQTTPSSQYIKQTSQPNTHIKKEEPTKQRAETDNEKLNEKLISYFRDQFTERKTDITNR